MLDIMRGIKNLRVKFPTFHKKEIVDTFYSEEWDSLIVSGIVVCALELTLFIIRYNEIVLPDWLENGGIYAFSAVISYSGQRLAYKILGTSEKVLGDKVDKMNP